jgi:hypothetical protein
VSNLGKIYERSEQYPELFRERSVCKSICYHYIEIEWKKGLVHRLVLSALLEMSVYIGCHRDDNQDNNSIENLYWGTHRENRLDASRNKKLRQLKN